LIASGRLFRTDESETARPVSGLARGGVKVTDGTGGTVAARVGGDVGVKCGKAVTDGATVAVAGGVSTTGAVGWIETTGRQAVSSNETKIKIRRPYLVSTSDCLKPQTTRLAKFG